MQRPRPGVDPGGAAHIQPLLAIQALRSIPLLGRVYPPDAAEGPGQAPVPVQPRGGQVGCAGGVREADHPEPHLHSEGQDRDSPSDPPHGHGHQQRRRLGPLLRLRRLPVDHGVRFRQVHHLQERRLQLSSVLPGVEPYLRRRRVPLQHDVWELHDRRQPLAGHFHPRLRPDPQLHLRLHPEGLGQLVAAAGPVGPGPRPAVAAVADPGPLQVHLLLLLTQLQVPRLLRVAAARPDCPAPAHQVHPSAQEPEAVLPLLRQPGRDPGGPEDRGHPARRARFQPDHRLRDHIRFRYRLHSASGASLRRREERVPQASRQEPDRDLPRRLRHLLLRAHRRADHDLHVLRHEHDASRRQPAHPQHRRQHHVPGDGRIARGPQLRAQRDRQHAAAEPQGALRCAELEARSGPRALYLIKSCPERSGRDRPTLASVCVGRVMILSLCKGTASGCVANLVGGRVSSLIICSRGRGYFVSVSLRMLPIFHLSVPLGSCVLR